MMAILTAMKPGIVTSDEADGSVEALTELVSGTEQCDAVWVESTPVVETFQGETVWEGVVEVFDLIGHRNLARCYAWTEPDGKSWVVSHYPPVNSPLEAVRASIVGRAQDPDYPD